MPASLQPRPSVRWGERRGIVSRLRDRLRTAIGGPEPAPREALPSLPLALRHGDLAERYLAAEGDRQHRAAGTAATAAMERALAAGEWWPADIWGHRALWHFEQAGMELAATRAARLIGEIRLVGGDPLSARRYYAEAITEARDLGAEREEGLAALGLGRAHLELGDVTTGRRLAVIAMDLLERCGAPADEVEQARELRGTEKPVGGSAEEQA